MREGNALTFSVKFHKHPYVTRQTTHCIITQKQLRYNKSRDNFALHKQFDLFCCGALDCIDYWLFSNALNTYTVYLFILDGHGNGLAKSKENT